MKSDYRYSKDIVYNNFVWPEGMGGGQRDGSNKRDRRDKRQKDGCGRRVPGNGVA